MKYLKFLPFFLISKIPFWGLYKISDFIFLLIYHIIGYRKKVVLKNLKIAFPYKSDQELHRISKQFYAHFCDLFVETIKLLTVPPKEIQSRILINNLDRIRTNLMNEQRVLLYAAHQGNWEWLTLLPLYFKTNASTFYKPLKSSYFNELFLLIRERFGVQCLPHKQGFKTLNSFQNHKMIFMSCLIGDQNPTAISSKRTIIFFSRQTDFFEGPARIANKIDAVVLFPYFKKYKRGHYELNFEFLAKVKSSGSEELLKEFASILERVIELSPELYLWTHKRWKRNGVNY